MALKPSNSSNLEQLAFKGLISFCIVLLVNMCVCHLYNKLTYLCIRSRSSYLLSLIDTSAESQQLTF